MNHSSHHTADMLNAKKILDDLLEKEEMYWQQRARVDWLKTGIENEAINVTLAAINSSIIANMNVSLLQNFTLAEVEDALNSMALDKSPGIDAIVSRFKKVLPVAISQNQSAFLPGRFIIDNVLLAFELVHCLKNKKRGCLGYAALKLDMSKAFDRVEWHFLEAVMLKMGFATKWVEFIMRCASSSTLCFNINGAIKGSVVPQRGLRQGDPISPYLFLICSEGLSALLCSEEIIGHLKGFSISRGTPSMSHLLFADDSLLFVMLLKILAKQLVEPYRYIIMPPVNCLIRGKLLCPSLPIPLTL
uniref:Reverse transcriptase domain-containing protein n=1 Tax=Cannabis sativa TaxID=3483 RepID=A0A803PT14_CANSA